MRADTNTGESVVGGVFWRSYWGDSLVYCFKTKNNVRGNVANIVRRDVWRKIAMVERRVDYYMNIPSKIRNP